MLNLFVLVNAPLEQFEIFNVFGYITNALFCSLLIILFFYFLLAVNKNYFLIVPSRWQRVIEWPFLLIRTVVYENINIVNQVYFYYIFIVFIIIVSHNIFGMIPYGFTVTSHLVITLYLSLATFIGIVTIGIKQHKLAIFNLFLPKGVPVFIIPALIVIEFISYVARVFSLAIRLFANMMSGHTLLKILAGFCWSMLNAGGFMSVLSSVPFIIIVAVTFLEVIISFLQGYVFIILLSIYINEVLNLH